MSVPLPHRVKIYRYHRCDDQHVGWPALAACIWPHATVNGNGPFGSASCGARVITLYADVDQAQTHVHDYDRNDCRPRCHQHHHVVDLTIAPQNAKPPNPARPVPVRPATAVPTPPRPDVPTCGGLRTNGELCRRPRGWGADTPGVGPCRDHGGSITERLARKERAVGQALAYARLLEGSQANRPLGVGGLVPGLLGSVVAKLLRDQGGRAS